MTIDIAHLEDQLLQMSAEGAPGQEFCEAISELARTGRFEQLRDVLPGIVYDELWIATSRILWRLWQDGGCWRRRCSKASSSTPGSGSPLLRGCSRPGAR